MVEDIGKRSSRESKGGGELVEKGEEDWSKSKKAK